MTGNVVLAEQLLDGELPLVPIEISDPATLEEIFRLRAKVWLELGAIKQSDLDNEGRFLDAWDSVSKHWAILYAGNVIASARLTFGLTANEVPYGSLLETRNAGTLFPVAAMTRLVVDSQHRRKGCMKSLDQIRINTAIELGAKTMIVNTNKRRKDYMLSCGFQPLFELNEEEALACEKLWEGMGEHIMFSCKL